MSLMSRKPIPFGMVLTLIRQNIIPSIRISRSHYRAMSKVEDEFEFLIRKGYFKEFIRRDQVERWKAKAQSSRSNIVGKQSIFRIINTMVNTTEE